MSNVTVAITLLSVSQQFTIYSGFLIMFTGVFGHLINISVLTSSRQFRRTPAAFYLIIESFADIIQITIPLGSRIAINGFDNDLTKTSIAWCKIRQFIVSTASLVAFSLICFAAFDQYLATSYYPHVRNWSSLRLARRLTCLALVVWPIHNILFLVLMEIRPPLGCVPTNTNFNLYFSYVHLLVWVGLLPIVISNTFALLAYFNVRRIVRRQIPVFRRRLDRQLTAMILARVAFLTVVVLPFVIQRIISLQVTLGPDDVIEKAIIQLLGSITFQMSYLHSAVSNQRSFIRSITHVLIAD